MEIRFKAHTGQRKRPRGEPELEALARRRPPSKAMRELVRQLYAPTDKRFCEQCQVWVSLLVDHRHA